MAVFGKRWSKEEIAILSKTDDLEELQILLPNRTLGAIKKKRLEQLNFTASAWTEEELLKFPTERVVNKAVLADLASKLPDRDKSQIWKKLKAKGYLWDKDFVEEVSEANPYPDHGKKWTDAELAHFPKEKEVTKEILEEVQALLPRRKPSSIWPKMKNEGYTWVAEEKETSTEVVAQELSKEEKYILSLAYELGFRKAGIGHTSLEPQLTNVEDHRAEIAKKFYLPEDFTSTQLSYAITTRMSPLPWEMEMIPELLTAYASKDRDSILAAAKVLHAKLGRFING